MNITFRRLPVNPELLTEEVTEALWKLDQTENVDILTLEEVMMCYYKRPCRRVLPGGSDARKFQRGSLLVYEGETVLVLRPEDNTLVFSANKTRFVGTPIKCFKGLLPGSRFYTSGRVFTVMMEKEQTRAFRQFLNSSRRRERCGNRISSFFEANSAGALNQPRCPEAFGLGCRIGVARIQKAVLVSASEVWA